MPIDLISPDVRNVIGELERNTGRPYAADLVTGANARALNFANTYHKHRDAVIGAMNATTLTIPAGVKRQAILTETVRAFARRAIVLSVFATVYKDVPLQGTDKIEVPYFPLQTDASTDWNSAVGYAFAGNATQQVKEITVNKRKYQALDYGSETFVRQPFFNAVQLGNMNAEKLAYDVIVDILSVVTEAKFGAAVKTVAEAAISSDDVIDIQESCNNASWPDAGRGLLVSTACNTSLQKDEAYKLALNAGGTEVLREGRLPNISGFAYAWMPSFPDNGENLIGIATFMSAIGCAFSPVDPAPEVRQQLYAYDLAVDPTTGIAMNYRAWGSAQMDRAYQVIETAYGYEALEAAALKRIVKP